eukprot:TRINITY_DN2787_c0_g1_i1.p1 TRINITY_DN2787_c0_g1~~TRINITY_DN2787_c0_g1_i1.p1  ORF type:complete len:442 (-),score=131.08 TRINITY_DN2787_c0_g1_i1:77-1402(-)
MSTVVKVYHGEDVYRFTFRGEVVFDDLLEKVRSRIKQEPGSFILKYEDQEGDTILLTCDEDVGEAVHVARQMACLKVHVFQLDDAAAQPSPPSEEKERVREERERSPPLYSPVNDLLPRNEEIVRDYSFKFVSNVTMHNGAKCSPGEAKVKIWKLRNTSDFDWPAGVKVVCADMKEWIDPLSRTMRLPAVLCGDVFEVQVRVNVPVAPGKYNAPFKVINPAGERFGTTLWIDFKVVDHLQSPSPARRPLEAAEEKFSFKFVSNETIPNGACCNPGESMMKIWRLRNIGKNDWPAQAVKVVCADEMAWVDPSSRVLRLPAVRSGADFEVAIRINVPRVAGEYRAPFKLLDPAGEKFGRVLWIDFSVLKSALVPNLEDDEVKANVARAAPVPLRKFEDEIMYDDQLSELTAMGFQDTNLNLYLLKEMFSGDTVKVVNYLLNHS